MGLFAAHALSDSFFRKHPQALLVWMLPTLVGARRDVSPPANAVGEPFLTGVVALGQFGQFVTAMTIDPAVADMCRPYCPLVNRRGEKTPSRALPPPLQTVARKVAPWAVARWQTGCCPYWKGVDSGCSVPNSTIFPAPWFAISYLCYRSNSTIVSRFVKKCTF